VADGIPVLASSRLSRLLQTAPFNVVEPAMIEASQPAIFDSPVA